MAKCSEDFFMDLTNTRPVLKLALQGAAGSGKSFTGAQIVVGLHRRYHSEKPVVIFDTEFSAKFLRPLFAKAGIPVKVKRSKALVDVVETIQRCQDGAADILMIDSMTHVYKGFLEAFKAEKRRSFIRFEDWSILKPEWEKRFTRHFVDAPIHIIFTGRQGFTYSYEVNDDGKRELIQTGVKMKVEGETAYEPDVLLHMERFEELLERDKKIWREATVIKDRSDTIDAQVFKDPTFDDVLPVLKFLECEVQPEQQGTVGDDRTLFPGGSTPDSSDRRQAQIWLERCRALMDKHTGGQKKEDKRRRIEALEHAFNDTSETAIKKLNAEETEYAYHQLEYFFEGPDNGQKPEAPPDEPPPADEPEPEPPEIGPAGGADGEEEKKTAELKDFHRKVLKLDPICRNQLCPNKGTAFGASVEGCHIINKSQGGLNIIGNGIGGCRDCHTLMDQGGQFDGEHRTGIQVKLAILEQWVGKGDWRWEGVYLELKDKSQKKEAVVPTKSTS